MNTSTERISQNVKDVRERQGLSQAALERLAGVSRSTIQSIERGTWEAQRQGPTLRKLADALDVSLAELRGEGDVSGLRDEARSDQPDAERQMILDTARDAMRDELGREPTEKEVNGWLLRAAVEKMRREHGQ